MPRPAITPSKLGVEQAGVMYLVKHGRLTVPEAARALSCHRETIRRLCKLLDINPKTARRRYADRLIYLATRRRLGQHY